MSEPYTYYDTILDGAYHPLFNGTPAETKEWLKANPDQHHRRVYLGEAEKVVSVQEYLKEDQ